MPKEYKYKMVKLLRVIVDNGYQVDDHMKLSLDWHLARLEGRLGRKDKLVNNGCPFCGEISDFLKDNKYCECLMETYQINYEKRHPLDGEFDQYEDRCISFMVASWASLAGNKVKNERKSVKKKVKTKLRKRSR